MSDIEFKKFIPTPTAKFIGIAEVMIQTVAGRILLRFKIVPGREGRGMFIGTASYGIENNSEGKTDYLDCITFDSNIAFIEIKDLIMKNVNIAMAKKIQNQASIFDDIKTTLNEPAYPDDKVPF
jgi:hypothetical protein